MGVNYHNHPVYFVVPLLAMVVVAALWYFRRRADDFRAFLSSCGLIFTLGASTGIGLYPYLLPSQPHPERSFTISNSASGSLSLQVGLIWLSFGLVLVIFHFALT